jgi:HEAT repeat protein
MATISHFYQAIPYKTLTRLSKYGCLGSSALVLWSSGVLAAQVFATTPATAKCFSADIQKYIELGREPTSFPQAASNLKACSPLAVPALIEQTDVRHDEVTRINAIFLMGELEEKAKSAIPALTALSKDSDKNIRVAAIGALGALGQVAVTALREVLQNSDMDSRTVAALALLQFEIVEENAIPAYMAILLSQNVNAGARFSAALALGRIGPEAKAAVPALRELQRMIDPAILEHCEQEAPT